MHEHMQTPGLIGGDIHFENVFQFLAEIFKHALTITVFVMIMMLLIEYLTVQTKGRWSRPLENNPWLQVIMATLLGLTPGCLGVYVVVTLYAHRLINFAALVSAMIATSGDESFVMLAVIPSRALQLMLIMFFISIFTGFILNLFKAGRSLMFLPVNYLQLHELEPDCTCFESSKIIPQLRKMSFERAILLAGGLIFTLLLFSGDIGPEEWDWKRVVFLIVTLIELFIVTTVPQHFLTNHLWGHVIKKHFLKIFLWTFGAFLLIHVGLEFLNLEEWLKENPITVLVLAVLIGIIPESGPHLIFITLFASGNIPFSILLANSIVQDGHGALPLLAESRKSFVYMKVINVLVGLAAGLAGLLAGF